MNIETLSTKYRLIRLNESHLDEIFDCCISNPLYYYYCPPLATHDSIKQDLVALPPGKTSGDKYFLGFYDQNQLIAVLDLILAYPNHEIVFIGFFMVHANRQKNHVGSFIIEELSQAIGKLGYKTIRLAFVEGNPQSEHFWKKNGFLETGIVKEQERYRVIVVEKKL